MPNNRDDIECRAIKALMDYFRSDHRKVELDSRLVEDLGVDSISLVEIILELNDAFDIELDGEDVAQWRTVDDICCSIRLCKRY